MPGQRLLALLILLSLSQIQAQDTNDLLFREKDSVSETNLNFLKIRLHLSIKSVKKMTNDSTYMTTTLFYDNHSSRDSIKVQVRTRGKFRLNNCYYPPLKLKFDKNDVSGSLFEGNRKLKLVLPCKIGAEKNDYIVREFLAYKLFESISSYYFKTRLVKLQIVEEKGKRKSIHELKGILIEDTEQTAMRYDGREYDHSVHPMQIDTLAAIRNSFFQYLIGNTDYSVKLSHNTKILFIDHKFIPIPYDFDMSGLVNSHYATVSNTQNLSLKIDEVTQRAYKGYRRDESLLRKVRQEFLNQKSELLLTVDDSKNFFDHEERFKESADFINDFFNILENDKKFEKYFIKLARTDQ